MAYAPTVTRGHAPDEPTLFFQQDVAHILLHHQLPRPPERSRCIAPDELRAGPALGSRPPPRVAAVGHASHRVALGDHALDVTGGAEDHEADLVAVQLVGDGGAKVASGGSRSRCRWRTAAHSASMPAARGSVVASVVHLAALLQGAPTAAGCSPPRSPRSLASSSTRAATMAGPNVPHLHHPPRARRRRRGAGATCGR